MLNQVKFELENFQSLLVQQPSSSQVPQATVVMQTTSQSVQRPVQQVQYINTNNLPITAADASTFQQVVQVNLECDLSCFSKFYLHYYVSMPLLWIICGNLASADGPTDTDYICYSAKYDRFSRRSA